MVEWLNELNTKIKKLNRKICLILDNTVSSSNDYARKYELMFLPPNTNYLHVNTTGSKNLKKNKFF